MSLVDYQSAYPWAQAIREEVLGLRMPPWLAEVGYGDFKYGDVLAPLVMDMMAKLKVVISVSKGNLAMHWKLEKIYGYWYQQMIN